jgi:hypothetical protein
MAVITASPKSFGRLIELQEIANENLRSIRSVVEMSRTLDGSANAVKTVTSAPSGNADESIIIEKETLKTQKEMLQQMKEDAKARAEDAADIAKLAQGVTTFKSIGEKLRDGFGSFKSKFSPDSLRKSFLSATNVGGINNKRLAREDFIQQQKSLGVQGSRAELKQKFEGAQSAAKSLQSNEAEFEKLKKSTGLNEDQLGKTERGKELLKKREQASADYSKFDARAGLVASGPLAQAPMTNLQPVTPSTAAQSVGENQEAQVEEARKMTAQNDLLQKIEENTRGEAPAQKASAASGEGGGDGLLGGLGKGLKSLGTGLGKGIGALLSGIGRGLLSMSAGLIALTPAIPVIGVLSLAAIGLGKALQLAAPAIDAFAPILMKVADVIGNIFMTAITVIPDILESIANVIAQIGDTIMGIMDKVVESIERLSQVDGGNLLSVGAGLVAIAGGLVAFSAGGAVAGVANLVGGLLGAITPGGGPVEQILKLGENGPNIEKAGIGVEKLAGGLKAFSGIDTEKIKAIAALPTDKIAAMGAAMQTPAAGVAAGSAQNQAARMAAQGGGGAQTNVVNAPVNNVTKQNQIIKSPVRNQESSQSRYINSKWGGLAGGGIGNF